MFIIVTVIVDFNSLLWNRRRGASSPWRGQVCCFLVLGIEVPCHSDSGYATYLLCPPEGLSQPPCPSASSLGQGIIGVLLGSLGLLRGLMRFTRLRVLGDSDSMWMSTWIPPVTDSLVLGKRVRSLSCSSVKCKWSYFTASWGLSKRTYVSHLPECLAEFIISSRRRSSN